MTTNDLLTDPCVSFWLKDAIKSLSNRDTLDALRDVELLHEIWEEKWHKETNSIN